MIHDDHASPINDLKNFVRCFARLLKPARSQFIFVVNHLKK